MPSFILLSPTLLTYLLLVVEYSGKELIFTFGLLNPSYVLGKISSRKEELFVIK